MKQRFFAATSLALFWSAAPSLAQTPEEFYRGKTLTIQVGYGVGGGYDTTARIVARHLGRHIPGNPTVVVSNMPGSGSLNVVNYLFNAAPRDGLTLGVFASILMLEPLRGNANVKADPARFNWIGSMHSDVNACAVWRGAGQNIASFDDLLKAKKTVVFGSTSPEAETGVYPVFFKKYFKAPVQVINGYKGTNEINLAMQTGEAQATCGMYESTVRGTYINYFNSNDMKMIFQAGLDRKVSLFGDATSAGDLMKSEEERQLGELIFRPSEITRPLAAPPGVPADRVAALRKALVDTMADPETLADGKRIGVDFTPMTGERIQEIIANFYKTPAHVVKRATELTRE
jgi:tripartite-type tricarboxylate transporter receptor subunit TctC